MQFVEFAFLLKFQFLLTDVWTAIICLWVAGGSVSTSLTIPVQYDSQMGGGGNIQNMKNIGGSLHFNMLLLYRHILHSLLTKSICLMLF